MNAIIALAAVEFITVHLLDGRVIQINQHEITQLVHAHEKGNREFVKGVHCIIRLTDSSYVSVVEYCEDVQKAMEEKK